MLFYNRAEAGKQLAQKLVKYANQPNVIVLGIHGGGVPVAKEVSQSLHLPVDLFVVRKLRLPEEPEAVFGAITSGGAQEVNAAIVKDLELTPSRIDEIISRERLELGIKERKTRGDRPFPSLQGKTVIVVDDGMGTGSSMRVVLEVISQKQPARIVIALPVAPPSVFYTFKELAGEIICLQTPPDFGKVRDYYLEFFPVTDEDVHKLLAGMPGQSAAV